MQPIDPKQFEQPKKNKNYSLFIKILMFAAIIFVLANLLILVVFRNKTYPKTTVGDTKIGSINLADLPAKLNDMNLIKSKILLESGDRKIELDSAGLISLNSQQVIEDERESRTILPLYDFLKERKLLLRTNIDQNSLESQKKRITESFHVDSRNAFIEQAENKFIIKPEVNQQDVDWPQLPQSIVASVAGGKFNLTPPLINNAPAVTESTLQAELNKLNQQLSADIRISYNGVNKKFLKSEMAKWYVPQNNRLEPADYIIKNSIEQFSTSNGISTGNLDELAQKAKQALLAGSQATLEPSLAPLTQKSFAYCVNQKGVDPSSFSELSSKLESVFNDPRGWNLGGHIIFKKSTQNCDFTIWLAAANQMRSFGAACDEIWSCAIGSNVIINFDRWKNASEAWNRAGLSLDDYHVMAINHEIGHFLGMGHLPCKSPGQRAPIMRQQSIDLEGCVFNPWPLEPEMIQVRTLQKI